MGVLVEKIYYPSLNGEDTVAALAYLPEGEPRAMVQLCHGMCEHKERYDSFARYLASHGFAVCINDHLGHGETARSEKYLGYFAKSEGYRFLVGDLYALTKLMKKRYPGLPYFLLGHSMGSFISRIYLAEHGRELTGAVIMGTAGKNPAIKLAFAAAKIERKRMGEFGRSNPINNVAFGMYNKRCTPHRTEYDWLSRDESMVDAFVADPKCGFLFTVSGYEDLFHLLETCSDSRCIESTPKDLPVLLTAGEEDPVGSYGKGVQEVYRRMREAGMRSVDLKLYPGCRHELLNETNRDQVYADLLSWLKSKLTN